MAMIQDNAEFRDEFGWSCRDYQRVPYECAKVAGARENCPLACGKQSEISACSSMNKFLDDVCSQPLVAPEYPWEAENRRRLASANRCPQTQIPGLLAATQIQCETDADDFPTGNIDSASLTNGLNSIKATIRSQYTNACDQKCQGLTVGGTGEVCISFIQPPEAGGETNRPTPRPVQNPTQDGDSGGGFPWWLILLMVLSILTLCCCCIFWAWYLLFMVEEEMECNECEVEPVRPIPTPLPQPIGYPVPAGGSFAQRGTIYGVDANRDGVISRNEMGFIPNQGRCAYKQIDDCNDCADDVGTQIPVPYVN